MSYFDPEDLAAFKAGALKRTLECDDLWLFLHSTLMSWCEYQGGVHGKGGDGFYKMKDGFFDVNAGAEYMEVALQVRTEFLSDRYQNEKSG